MQPIGLDFSLKPRMAGDRLETLVGIHVRPRVQKRREIMAERRLSGQNNVIIARPVDLIKAEIGKCPFVSVAVK